MVRAVGLLDKIRMVKESPMMVCFTLTTINKPYNCIVVKPELVFALAILQASNTDKID